MSVPINLAARDWLPPVGEDPGELVMQVTRVTLAGSASRKWVRAYGWRHPDEHAETPETVCYLVRFAALPTRAQALLEESADV